MPRPNSCSCGGLAARHRRKPSFVGGLPTSRFSPVRLSRSTSTAGCPWRGRRTARSKGCFTIQAATTRLPGQRLHNQTTPQHIRRTCPRRESTRSFPTPPWMAELPKTSSAKPIRPKRQSFHQGTLVRRSKGGEGTGLCSSRPRRPCFLLRPFVPRNRHSANRWYFATRLLIVQRKVSIKVGL